MYAVLRKKEKTIGRRKEVKVGENARSNIPNASLLCERTVLIAGGERGREKVTGEGKVEPETTTMMMMKETVRERKEKSQSHFHFDGILDKRREGV